MPSSSRSPRSPAPGDHIVASSSLYGGSVTQLDVTLRRFGVDTTFIQGTDPEAYAAAITDKTKLIFVESISNPSGEIADLAALADVAHAHHLPLIVDSTVATPYLNRPIEWGADVVIHSATKFLGGHGTTLGGVVVESGRFHWANERFPLFDQEVAHYGGLNWHGNFGEYAFLTRLRAEQLRDIGPVLAPHSAWLLAQGVETLPFRMQAHVDNARIVAEWLEADKRIEFVNWAGLASHPHHERAKVYLPKGPGSVFSFGVKGSATADSRQVGRTFIESVDLAQPPREHRRREDARHPSRFDDARPAQRAAAAGCRRAARSGAHQRGHRGSRGHHRRPRPSARRRDRRQDRDMATATRSTSTPSPSRTG